MTVKRKIYQFKVELLDTSPPIWRQIQVPEKYSFWDLHVAIQDSMGWFDCHLHAFRFGRVKFPKSEIGIPDDEGFSDVNVLPGWEVSVRDHFDIGKSCTYEYDFGDCWTHKITLEGILLAEKGCRYPVCLAGGQLCPPEDCGGIPGYYRMLEILSDPDDDEHEEMVVWTGGNYDPNNFDPSTVKFDNPNKRWDYAFSGSLYEV